MQLSEDIYNTKIVPRGKYKYKGINHTTIPEHRIVMHQIDPQPNESELVVHHINGDKSDNSPGNLVWMTQSEHSRLHHLGENHYPCSGRANPNYRHGECVNGHSKVYKKFHNHKAYMKNRTERLAKQNAYGAKHRDHKRWYDKVRYWERQVTLAASEERKAECLARLHELKESKV